MSASRSEGRAGGDHLPSAPLENLRARARVLAAVRSFFEKRGVLEVETPVLCRAGVVDVHLDPFAVNVQSGEAGDEETESRRYLMTSPELCMKRLIAAGSGPIYQLTRAFRRGERGRLHHPEFTILEWYRPGYDLSALMGEVEALVREAFSAAGAAREGPGAGGATGWREPFDRISYRTAFERALGVDPLAATIDELEVVARDRGAAATAARQAGPAPTRDDWLNLLLASCVEGTLGARPTFLHQYPASQAALARLSSHDERVAERFELYLDGVELANGYHELTDAAEQKRRFEEANEERVRRGKERLPMDDAFLRSLESGLPDCSGVALGVDRMLLLALGAAHLDEVMAFSSSRA